MLTTDPAKVLYGFALPFTSSKSPVLPRDRVATASSGRRTVAPATSSWRRPCSRGDRRLQLSLACRRQRDPRRWHYVLGRPFRVNGEILASRGPSRPEERTVKRVVVSYRHRLLSKQRRSCFAADAADDVKALRLRRAAGDLIYGCDP